MCPYHAEVCSKTTSQCDNNEDAYDTLTYHLLTTFFLCLVLRSIISLIDPVNKDLEPILRL